MESCSPYLETDTLCKKECFSDVYKLSDYGYIGKGYYGSTNEKVILLSNYKFIIDIILIITFIIIFKSIKYLGYDERNI
jgi:hypothetical protein